MLFDQFDADGHSGSEDEQGGLDDEKKLQQTLMQKANLNQGVRGVVVTNTTSSLSNVAAIGSDLSISNVNFDPSALSPVSASRSVASIVASDTNPILDVSTFTDFTPPSTPAGNAKIVAMCAANDVLLIATDNGQITRLDLSPEGTGEQIDILLPKTSKGDQVRKIFLDPSGQHAFISCESKTNYYLLNTRRKVVQLSKPKNIFIESVGWNRVQTSSEGTGHIVMGCSDGSVYELLIENEKEKVSKKIWQLPGSLDVPVCGLLLELFPDIRLQDEEKHKWYIVVATPQIHYQFIGGPSIESVFSKDVKSMHHLPGDTKNGELQCFRSDGRPKLIAHLTGSGIYVGNIEFSSGAVAGASLITKDLTLSYADFRKLNPPLSIYLSEFHILMLYENQLLAVNHLSNELVFDRSFTKNTGKLKGFARDERGDTIYLFSENSIFDIRFNHEERDIWRILYQKEQFVEALYYCNSAQREIVLNAQSNYFFERQEYEKAATSFALSSRTFEEVALKFIQRGATQGLKTYLLSRLESYVDFDQEGKLQNYVTQRIMISTWLVEIFLNQINELRDSSVQLEKHTKVVKEFHDFLKTFRSHIHAESAFHLISSHGLEDEMMHFAELIGDYDRMISYHIAQCEYRRAVSVLNSLQDQLDIRSVEDLFYKHAPLLFHYEPRATVDSLMLVRSLDPSKFLPALMRYDVSRNSAGDTENHAIRYIEFCLKKRGHRDPALYNYLISLYVKDPTETKILEFITSQDPQTPYYDMKYALRICHQEGKIRSCVYLYSFMGLYADAVKLALSIEDLELAKQMANIPQDTHPDKRKLWLLIGEFVVKKEQNTEKAITLLKECKVLHIEDILPLFPDHIRIGDFKDEISKALSEYTDKIANLKNEMNVYTATADRIRKDIQKLKNRHSEISASRTCDLCFKPVLLRHFYLYPCTHAVHVDCAEAHVRKHVAQAPNRLDYFKRDFDIGIEDLDPVLGGLSLNIAPSRSDAVDFAGQIDRGNIKELTRSECIFCGDIMIEQVKIPFINYDDESEELKSWAI